MRCPVVYKVRFWDEIDKKSLVQSGFTFASSFSEAAGILEKVYGNDLMTILRLELLDESEVLPLSSKMVNEIVAAYNACEEFREEDVNG